MQSRINLPAPDAAPLGAAGTVLNVPQGADIFSQGDACDVFFRVVSGAVRICRYLGDGRRLIDAFYGEEEFFGLSLDEARLFSAEALNDCVLVSYRRSAVLAQAETDVVLARQLFHIAMQGQARARRHALLLSRRSAGEKMAGFLLQQAAGGRDITLAMTRQDIGDYLGLTIETVSRSLHQFERQGLITISGNRGLCLTARAALEQLAAS